MQRVLLTKLTELFELKTILKLLFVLFAVIVDTLTLCALKFCEIILGHRVINCARTVTELPLAV